jgi:phage major head subunit gpT-like protein
MKVRGMAEMYQAWLAQEAYRALILGCITASTNPYGTAVDSLAFYATTHDLGGGTIDNLDALELTADNLKLEIGKMKSFRGDGGRYLGVNPTHLVVAPAAEFIARELLTPAPGATTGQSLWGRLQLEAPPYWDNDVLANTGGNDMCWGLYDCSKLVKPLIFQQRTGLEFAELTMNSDIGFMRDEWLFGVRVRCAFGYGAYWLGLLNQDT